MIEDTKFLLKKFLCWAQLKFKIHTTPEHTVVYFREREVWWCALGINIGYEQNGKHENFERPVLILKKFSKHFLWVLPMTSKQKFGKFYYRTDYNGSQYYIILSQIRALSSKRLLRKLRTLSQSEFYTVKKRVKEFL